MSESLQRFGVEIQRKTRYASLFIEPWIAVLHKSPRDPHDRSIIPVMFVGRFYEPQPTACFSPTTGFVLGFMAGRLFRSCLLEDFTSLNPHLTPRSPAPLGRSGLRLVRYTA